MKLSIKAIRNSKKVKPQGRSYMALSFGSTIRYKYYSYFHNYYLDWPIVSTILYTKYSILGE